MMPLRVFSLLLMFWAGAGLAQTVEVRAGEHDTFTRLVFNLPDRMGYELRQSPGQARLTLARRGLKFDTRAVFQKVPRTRLTGIDTPDGGRSVTLSLACDCEIQAFWYARSSLVLDIRTPANALETVPSETPEKTSEPRTADVMAVLQIPPERHGTAAQLAASAFARTGNMIPGHADSPPLQMAASSMLEKERDHLLREIGRAASQGLLSPRVALPEQKPPVSAPSPSSTAPVAAKPAQAEAASNIQLRAETSIDRDMRDTLLEGLGTTAAVSCLDPARVDISAWGTDAPFAAQIAPLRSRLMGEFDEPDPAAAIGLARVYLYFGFGAEARLALDQFGGADQNGAVLREMAEILENGNAGEDSLLAGQMECAPMTALWSALSYRSLPANVPLDADAILRGFSALPPHLRAYLGPGLARSFLEAGYDRESATIRRMLDRSDATVTAESSLLDADVALSEGALADAEKRLDSIVRDNATPSAEALVRLINTRLGRGAEISYDLAQLAGAYATEHRGSPLGTELARVYLVALAASGAFDQAFSEMPRVLGDNAEQRGLVRSELLGILAQRADDFDFLKHALVSVDDSPASTDPAIANSVARRLLSLGFVEAAAAIVEPETTGSPARARKLLRAEVALRRNRPRQAEVELLGLTGKDVNLLRARARSMVDEHRAARTLFASAGAEDEALREAWLGGDWPVLAAQEGTPLSTIATERLERQTAAPAHMSEGVLARDRRLIQDSARTRDTVDALLAAHPSPVEGE